MGYRFLVVLCAIFMIGGCAAFDSDADPYTGFDPSIIPVIPGGVAGIHNGFYSGTMTLDSNECAGLSEEVGTSTDFAVDVIHVDNYLNVTFEDGTLMAGELVGDGAVFMIKDGSTEDVYYLNFSDEDGTVTGSFEVIEPNDDGQYAEPCASYSISMEEGDKPEGFGEGGVITNPDGEDSGADSEEPEGQDETPPWEMPDEI